MAPLCTIKWNTLDYPAWAQRFDALPRSNLLQSYEYARAACALNGQRGRWGLIYIDGREAGLVQILEIGALKNMLHAVMLDRGPLWFEGFGTPQHFEAFVQQFEREFPRRFGRRRRFIPEHVEATVAHEILSRARFRKQGGDYETFVLDLQQNEEDLLRKMEKKWRNALNKGLRSGLSIEWDSEGAHFPWLLKAYLADKTARGYDGPSEAMLRLIGKYFIPERRLIIGRAVKDKNAVAGILILCHGSAATYQIGWNSEEGRALSAHHLLLWEALEILKERNIQTFDLGGVNDTKAAGVKTFKEGMGGDLLRLAGLYT